MLELKSPSSLQMVIQKPPGLFGRWWSFLLLALAISVVTGPRLVVADPDHEIDTADWMGVQIDTVDGFFPTPWLCSTDAPSGIQSILQFHENWHCTNPGPSADNPNWGNRFFGFHKQFLQGYNHFLAARNEKKVQTWVPYPGAPIPPGHYYPYTPIPPPALRREKGTPCTFCESLDSMFVAPGAGGTLDEITSVRELGERIYGWHGGNHMHIAAAGGIGGCGGDADMGCPEVAPRDPIFYRYHHIFDDIQKAWRSLQPTDIAIVLDRSSSMAGTRLDAAKQAAALFAALLEEDNGHKLGMVSFATTASDPPDMPLTSVPAALAALSGVLSKLIADGATSIGDGLEKAQTLITGGSEARKAILLLTDGEENVSPWIADATPLLGDTHVCSIGLGTALNGPKLRDLSENQGGIYITTPNLLELKKFFVTCFADIFDTFGSEGPIDTLPAGQFASTPTIHHAFLDQKIVFVLGWTHPLPAGTLKLAITTPFGNVLNLDAPDVDSKFGPTWHIVRIKTPYRGERDGDWTARAVRPIRTYVNGFSSRSFDDLHQGIGLVRTELSNLCPDGCHNILYYEDPAKHKSFADHNTIYSGALSGQPGLGNITRPANATEFRDALSGYGERGFDLLVYSSQFTKDKQPYDEVLANVLCSNSTRAIVSDNRCTEGARAVLRCAGAVRGNQTNFDTIVPSDSSSLLDHPAKLRAQQDVGEFSYEILPTKGSISQARSTTKAVAVVAQGEAGEDEKYFITVLTRSMAKVKPFSYRNNTYTLEDLHPTFHIPSPYWPACGFDTVTATVNITRPVSSLAKLHASIGSTNGTTAGQILDNNGTVIPTETQQFTLYDDGTHGDSTANDHYWEVSLPPDFTAVDGDYHLHTFFRLCKTESCGKQNCINREAQQTITIRAQIQPKCSVIVKKVSQDGDRCKTRILITPVDKNGTPLGPGLANELMITAVGDVKVESVSDQDGRGTYEILVDASSKGGKEPELIIAQFGRPGNAIHIKL